MDLVISKGFPNPEGSMNVGSRAVRMLPQHTEGSSSPAAQRTATPGPGTAGRCHLHGRAVPAAAEPREAVPCWHPWLQAGLTSAGRFRVLRDKAELRNILPMEPLGVCLLMEIKAGVGSAARGAAALAQLRENENKPQSFLFPSPLTFSGNADGPYQYFYVCLLLSFWPKSVLPQIFG